MASSFKITKGPLKGKTVTYAKNSYGELLYEIPAVTVGIEPLFVSDESHLLDFGLGEDDYPEARLKFYDFYGMELPENPQQWSLGELAAMILKERRHGDGDL